MFSSDSGFLNRFVEGYLWTWTTIDHRVDGWPLMHSIQPIFVLLGLYFLMVDIGPKLMSNRKAIDVKWTMITYNVSISLLNLYIVVQFILSSIRLNYNWVCEVTHSESTDREEMRMVTAIYLYLISKPIEWLDTFFFIIRKKDSQLSALHIYHHSSIFLISWILTRWVPSRSTYLPMLLNSFVHVIMYTYYALAALGPNVQKYLWWKKYITIMQLTQFALAMTHGINGITTGCPYTKWIQYLVVLYMVSFLFLFGMFYRNTYIKASKKKINQRVNKEANSSNSITNSKLFLDDEGLRKRTIITNF